MVDVNAHLHTPFSFSAFGSVDEALDQAAAEGVRVVGINDFYTTDGYGEWDAGCRARGLYPLFGIEMIALDQEFQRAGIKVNDPSNPGRTYISGKGLAFPARLPEPYAGELAAVRRATDAQVRAMCSKLNDLAAKIGAGFALDADEITRTLTRGSLRERHLAKALRLAVWVRETDDDARRRLLEKFFGGKGLKADIANDAAVENEIRGNLLKAGGAAFVAETPEAFLPVGEVTAIIEAAGGIPTYPFLADDAAGNFTDFEADLTKTIAELRAKGIHSTEFISTRNSAAELERYAAGLWEAGFVVTLGTEHNTPAPEPILLSTRGGAPLTDRLREINYRGACVVAAHQHNYALTGQAYDPAKRDEYAAKGDKLIRQWTER
jgi:sugar phosphate isomerase/epimerase